MVSLALNELIHSLNKVGVKTKQAIATSKINPLIKPSKQRNFLLNANDNDSRKSQVKPKNA